MKLLFFRSASLVAFESVRSRLFLLSFDAEIFTLFLNNSNVDRSFTTPAFGLIEWLFEVELMLFGGFPYPIGGIRV